LRACDPPRNSADINAQDAYVIECARRYQTPILSLDRRQLDVAQDVGLQIVEV